MVVDTELAGAWAGAFTYCCTGTPYCFPLYVEEESVVLYVTPVISLGGVGNPSRKGTDHSVDPEETEWKAYLDDEHSGYWYW